MFATDNAKPTLHDLASVCEQVASTSSRLEKQRLLAAFLAPLPDADLYCACTYLTGRPLPPHEEAVPGVGGAIIARVLQERAGGERFFASSPPPRPDLGDVYRRFGDLGDTAHFLLQSHAGAAGIALADLDAAFRRLAAALGPRAKARQLALLLDKVTALEAKYLIKILTGDLRIGAKEGLLESTVAEAFGQDLAAVQRALLYAGDLGEVALAARQNRLPEIPFRLFHPVRFMLAQPIAGPGEAVEVGLARWMVEDKYDGIRAQVHKDSDRVRIYSRSFDEVHRRFPELAEGLLALPGSFLLDGEIVASDGQQLLPFSHLQRRLGRRHLGPAILRDFPCRYVAFDLLYHDGRPLFDVPLTERRQRLEHFLQAGGCLLSAQGWVENAAQIEAAFAAARSRGNEGILLKDPASLYTPGRRGKAWLKLKRPLETLDCVVVAAEYGHGKRHGLLSDYTFAVRDADRLVTIAKAYSGLTDDEIEELTRLFREQTLAQEGSVHCVRPQVVMEVAFDAVNKSDRHTSGYALRFPRIVRIRPDKRPDEVDTLQRVEEIYRRLR